MTGPSITFRFPCPLGHLLEGDAAEVGRPCECPLCGTSFAIPARTVAEALEGPPIAAPPRIRPPSAGLAAWARDLGEDAAPAIEVEPPRSDPLAESRPDVLHIPCPKGHELETPLEMLGQYAMCPECGTQFRLREQDSLEHRRKQQQELEARTRRLGNAWLKWAVLTTVFVLLGLLVLIFASSHR